MAEWGGGGGLELFEGSRPEPRAVVISKSGHQEQIGDIKKFSPLSGH